MNRADKIRQELEILEVQINSTSMEVIKRNCQRTIEILKRELLTLEKPGHDRLSN